MLQRRHCRRFQRIYWIAGGLPKEGGIEPLRAYFPRIAKAYLIGEAAPAFSATLGEAVPYEISGTLDAAVEHAAADAARDEAGEVAVLLIPGLRKLRPVQEFRGTWRSLPGGCRGHRGGSTDRRGALMPSRVDKSPVANWWWTVDRWFLAAFLSLMGLGIVLSFAASPAVAERIGLDSFHFATRQIIFTHPGARRDAVGVVPRRAPDQAHVDHHAVRDARADGRGALRRRRGEGRAALGVVRRAVDPAVGIPEAGLRHHLRLAVRRACAPAGHSGQSVCDHPARAGAVAAGRAARSRPDDAGARHLGRDVLHGRHAVAVDHRAGRAGRRRRVRRLYDLPACGRPHRPLPDRRGRHVPGRHGPRGASCTAAGSASARARAPSSASSPTAMPTSCSRSPARSSASCCACSSCSSSPSS